MNYILRYDRQAMEPDRTACKGGETSMDWVHLFLVGSAVLEIAALVFIAWGMVKVAYSTVQVEETAKGIAEMANRNERMTQSILQKVYDVSRPQA
jgi:hypothetical protein